MASWCSMRMPPPGYAPPISGARKSGRSSSKTATPTGATIPIGERPDGRVWTGFASVAKDRRSARILVFRELNEDHEWATTIPLLHADDAEVTLMGGQGEARFHDGKLHVSVDEKLQYLFLKVD